MSESQLQAWSNPGAQDSAATTYASIRSALMNWQPLQRVSFEVYLQGSYPNHTNTRGNSDVDVVCELRDTFFPDDSLLPPEQFLRRSNSSGPATITLEEFDQEVQRALRFYFGAESITVGNKAISVSASPSRLKPDVLPCATLKRFTHFYSWSDFGEIPGIIFFTRNEGRKVTNFPKVHLANGIQKNSYGRTAGEFKPNVRVAKNIRNKLVELHLVPDDIAPSHFVESLPYNAPDSCFTARRTDSLIRWLGWFLEADLTTTTFQHEQTLLFGPSPDQWDTAKAVRFVSSMIGLLSSQTASA